MESSVKTFTDHFDEFADNSSEMLAMMARCRDYYDGDQLTPQELSVLKARKQPPVVRNRIQAAILKILGAETQTRSDPKAYPVAPEDENGSDAITKGLRYVADNNDLDETNSQEFEYQIIEGVCGAITEIDPSDLSIEVNELMPDRVYWDVHSRKNDFSDSKRFGFVTWMDLEDVTEKWPDHKDVLTAHMKDQADHVTFDDQPSSKRWVDKERNRIMVMQEYYKKGPIWREVFFCQCVVLQDNESPYLDCDGLPSCPIELQSSFVKRDGTRYGLVKGLLDLQDEVNKRGSKALHLLNVNQTMSEEGAVKNVNRMKTEKAKPDGHIELNPGALESKRFQFIDQTNELSAHLQLMQEAKAEIEELSIEAQVSATASGRSRELEIQDQLVKIGRIFDRYRNWKKRIYRQIWARMKQFWDEEKWIRVTDDEQTIEFIGLNQPVTLGQLVQEHAERSGEEIPLEFLNDSRMSEVVEVRNEIKKLNMDIVLDDAPHYVTLQHELLAAVLNAINASGQALPPDVVLDLMPAVPNKQKLKERLQGDEQAQAKQQALAEREQQLNDLATQLELEKKSLENAKTGAEIEKLEAETVDEMASAEQRLAIG